MFRLPLAVWLLGWVSLATDAASEAIYPLLPFFLIQVLGAGAVSLGIVEGAAEAANSVLKIISGRAADRARSKRPLVLAGYGLSSAVRPLIAVARTWTHVFAVRLLDRVGKGVRTAPRDAMLAAWTTPATRGKVYGFHRAMDHAGAVLGPSLASLFLFFYPGEYRTLFALTVIPGAIAVLLIFVVPEPDQARLEADPTHAGLETRATPVTAQTRAPAGVPQARATSAVAQTRAITRVAQARAITGVGQDFSPAVASAPLPQSFKRFILVLALFMLGNSTDAFLLLKLTDAAGSVAFVPLMWAAHHVVKAAVSVVGGSWSDRIGRRAVIATGWLVYAAVYAGFAVSTSLTALLAWFLVYGFYFGFAEGTEKALVADLAPASRLGYAFGVYNAVQGAGALAASVVFGIIWTALGPAAAFGTGAGVALLATALLFVVVPKLSAVSSSALN